MSIIQLLPDSGITFANGVNIKLKKDSAGAQGNITISMSGGPLADICTALNIPSLDLVTTLVDLGRLGSAIGVAQSAYRLV